MALPDYPITRNEQYLSRIAGENHPIPDYPITREEQYLAEIAEGGIIPATEKGAPGGVATLDADGKVPEEQLPGGGGGLPPVTGSGKALIGVNGEWVEQSGFPYDEGETTETKFDETFSGFTRGTDEDTNYLYPIDTSDEDKENNVVIGGVTYYYVDGSVYDYSSIDRCSVRDQDWNSDYLSGLEFVQSGAVKKVEIPYSITQYDPDTEEPIGTLTGTLYGVYAPTDGAQDEDGNTFPAAGFYCTVNGDLSDSFVGVGTISMTYTYPSLEWISEHSVDEPLPDYEDGKNYRVYLDDEVAEGGGFNGSINFDEGYVTTEDDGEGGYKAVCYLFAVYYETAPDSISIKLEEATSGVHPMDGKLLFGENVQDGTALVNVSGEMTKQDGYAYRTPEDYNEVYSADSTVIVSGVGEDLFQYSALIGDDEYDVGETIVHSTLSDYTVITDNAIGIYLRYWGNFTPEFSERSGDVGVIRHDDEMWIIVSNPSSTAGSDLNNCYFEYPGIYTNSSEEWFEFLLINSGDYVACFSEFDFVYNEASGIGINSSDIFEFVGSSQRFFGNGSVFAHPDYLFAVLLSEEDSQYISDDSATVTLYSVEGGTVPFNSDYIPWYEMPSDAIHWSYAPVGTGLPEPTYEDGTYILQATENDGEMEYEWSKADTKAMVVTYDDDTTETFNVLIQSE